MLKRLQDERGQAMVEYAVAVAVTTLGTYAVIQGVLAALRTYYQEVTTLLCLPIP